jgi:glycerol kinase
MSLLDLECRRHSGWGADEAQLGIAHPVPAAGGLDQVADASVALEWVREGGPRADGRADALSSKHESFALERLERVPQSGSRNAMIGSELRLGGKPRTHRQFASGDPATNRVRDDCGAGLFLDRYRHLSNNNRKWVDYFPEAMADLILALDQGTSATKACIYEPPGRLLASATVAVGSRSPAPGALEQDPTELVESCRDAAEQALRKAGIQAADLAGCALANTGESFLLFDRTGRAVTPVIGWQDSRAGSVIEALEARGAGARVEELTGLPLHSEFTAPKLAHWLARLGARDDLRFGTLDTWIAACLDPSGPHVTDRATASRTMLLDLRDDDWSNELIDVFAVPRGLLPTVRPSDGLDVSLALVGAELPLLASCYDMGLALLGHACLEPGESKATFGTCLGVMAATGDKPRTADGLLSTIAYTRGPHNAYAFDGEIAAAGSLVQWALGLGIASSPQELDGLAASVSSAGGAVVVPAITGLGAPHWRDDVSGRIVGLSAGVGRPELARAVLDAIAYSLRDVVEALRAAGLEVGELRVDGGLTRSDTLIQRCADVCGLPMVRSAQEEATAFGAAALAMLATGRASPDELRAAVRDGARTVEPAKQPSADELQSWRDALSEALAER